MNDMEFERITYKAFMFFLGFVLMISLSVGGGIYLGQILFDQPPLKMDCSTAQWHPDATNAQRDACRRPA